jgi:ABC-2 type transport system ATP-binding protein
MTTDVMISASGLSKQFGTVRALDKVTFEVKRGEVVGFLGPNGAGKSTTMRILTCFISPSAGTAQVSGHDVFDAPLEVRRSLGYLPQRAPLYGDMSVREYLRFAAEIRGLDDSQFNKSLKRVIHDPQILILDEPTSDLDPNEKAEVLKYIKEIGKDRTILLSTHNLAEVEEACARAIIVSKGRVVADGALDGIRSQTGAVRYRVTVDEKHAEGGKAAPSAAEVSAALAALSGAKKVRELPTDETAHKFELAGAQDGDLRAEIFRLMVQKSWTLLELRRDAQSLDVVFRELTRGDERLDRGRALVEDEANSTGDSTDDKLAADKSDSTSEAKA